jgi:hypothetical protein
MPNRDKTIKVRVTKEEWKALENAARASSLSVSALIRFLALGSKSAAIFVPTQDRPVQRSRPAARQRQVVPAHAAGSAGGEVEYKVQPLSDESTKRFAKRILSSPRVRCELSAGEIERLKKLAKSNSVLAEHARETLRSNGIE